MSVRICWLVGGLFLVSLQLSSQNQRSDSLMRVALATPYDSTRVLRLNEVATSLRESDTNLALKYAEEAKDLALKLNFTRGLGYVFENIGWIYYRKGNYSEALEISNEALRINQANDEKREVANCLNNIGAINFEQKIFDVAIENFKKGLELAKEVNDPITMSRSLNNIAFSFLKLRQLDSARYYTTRAINQHINDKFRASFSQRMLGDISYEEGDYKSALNHYSLCLKGADEHDNNFLKTSTLYRMGKVYLKLNEPDRAVFYLNQNLPIAKKFEYRSELESTYKLLAEAYGAKKDFAKAFSFQTQYQLMHDSLVEQKSGQEVALIQAKHDFDRKNSQIELLTKNSKIQRIWIYAGIAGLFLLLLLVAILIRNNRRVRMVNKLLAEKNNLINEQTDQLIGLNSTKDKLFSIIGHDLRSPLNSLRGMMGLLSNAAMSQDEFIELSKKLKKNVDFVYSDLENLLSWAQTQQKGLVPTFEDVIPYQAAEEKINLYSELVKSKSIGVVNEIDPHLSVLADKNQFGLVLRNLIGNAIKFNNQGGKIHLRSAHRNDYIEISVTDTGTGMSDTEMNKLFKAGSHFSKPGTQNEKGIGLGLLLVKEFVELNNGKIEVTSKPGEGSTFRFFLKGKMSPSA